MRPGISFQGISGRDLIFLYSLRLGGRFAILENIRAPARGACDPLLLLLE